MTMKHMKSKHRSLVGALLVSMALVGCGGSSGDGSMQSGTASVDVTGASIVTSATKTFGGTDQRDGGFEFPEITMMNGEVHMAIPAGSTPKFAARRTVGSGNGQIIGFGDPVILKYDMFKWSTGELVESSAEFAESHTILAGNPDNYPVPDYLAKSFLGRKNGDTVQVVLPAGSDDLPIYLDPNDAYIVLVEVL